MIDQFDKEFKERILREYKYNNGFLTIQDIADYCNDNKIPLHLDENEIGKLSFYYFRKDEIEIKEMCEMLPITIYVEHILVSDFIEYSQQALLEYLKIK